MHVQSVDGPLDQTITEENDLKQPEYNTKSSFISRYRPTMSDQHDNLSAR